jgi:excisionase family DNA binding protein
VSDKEKKVTMTVKTIVDLYDLPERTVWDLIARRDVESAKVGKRRLVWRESLERYLQGVTE